METSKKEAILTVRMSPEEKQRLEEIASRFEISTAFMVRRMLRAGMDRQSNQRLTLNANVIQKVTA